MEKPVSTKLVDLVTLNHAEKTAFEFGLIESAMDYLPDLVIILDKTSVIRAVNLAFCEKFGYQRNEIINRNIKELNPPASSRLFAEKKLLPTTVKGCYVRENHSIQDKTGQPCLLDCIKIPLLDEDAHNQGLLFVGYDITKQAKQSKERETLISSLKDTLSLLEKQSGVLKKMNRELEDLATTDPLTKVNNRRYFDQNYQIEWRRCRRDHAPLALMMIDIDYFKPYNDHYGHTSGDTCLTQVAQALSQLTCKRPGDLFARYGGEEFISLLPNTTHGLKDLAEQSVQAISSLAIEHIKSMLPEKVVTISVGAAVGYPHLLDNHLDLLDLADQQLYLAKQKGRNTCEYLVISEDGSNTSHHEEN